MKTTITAQQRRRLDMGISNQVRQYERCRRQLRYIDKDIFETGMQVFNSETALALWLCEPARALGGKIPLLVMRTAKSRKTVANILGAIIHGGYL